MNKSILMAAMVAVALTACGEDKKPQPRRHPHPPHGPGTRTGAGTRCRRRSRSGRNEAAADATTPAADAMNAVAGARR